MVLELFSCEERTAPDDSAGAYDVWDAPAADPCDDDDDATTVGGSSEGGCADGGRASEGGEWTGAGVVCSSSRMGSAALARAHSVRSSATAGGHCAVPDASRRARAASVPTAHAEASMAPAAPAGSHVVAAVPQARPGSPHHAGGCVSAGAPASVVAMAVAAARSRPCAAHCAVTSATSALGVSSPAHTVSASPPGRGMSVHPRAHGAMHAYRVHGNRAASSALAASQHEHSTSPPPRPLCPSSASSSSSE
jgi:hypothetical protein